MEQCRNCEASASVEMVSSPHSWFACDDHYEDVFFDLRHAGIPIYATETVEESA